jgi:predicted dehydrogenase
MIVDDGSGEQWRYAIHPLERGIATFCDKPIAMTTRDAKHVAALARRTGAKLMSGSSLRFVPEILGLRDELPSLGDVHLVTVACHNELMYYGVHALSMAYALFGPGAISCINVGHPDLNILRVRFGSERDVVVLVGEQSRMSPGYQINVFGQSGWRTVTPDLTHAYSNLVQAFIDYLVSGIEPFSVDEEVEIVAVLEAGRRSLAEGREVLLTEFLT